MPDRTATELRRTIGTSQLFTLSFGSIVGAGWVVGVGVWLNHAGPVGTALAFTAGGLMMILVGLCYGEMTAAIPVSGGELAYAYAVFGAKTCFAVGWFLALGFVVTTIFEALTSVWLIGSLLPGALGPVLYHAFGEPMRPGGLAIGLGGTVIITALNYFGVRQAVTTQDILTYTKIAIAVLLVACGLFAGHVSNLRPLFQYDAAGGAWRGIAAVLLTVPFWLSGLGDGGEGAADPGSTRCHDDRALDHRIDSVLYPTDPGQCLGHPLAKSSLGGPACRPRIRGGLWLGAARPSRAAGRIARDDHGVERMRDCRVADAVRAGASPFHRR